MLSLRKLLKKIHVEKNNGFFKFFVWYHYNVSFHGNKKKRQLKMPVRLQHTAYSEQEHSVQWLTSQILFHDSIGPNNRCVSPLIVT